MLYEVITQALAAAQEMETEIGSGNPRSPLQGIPVAYKDIYDVRDLPTSGGRNNFV